MSILKTAGNDITFSPVNDGVFSGSKIAEIFATSGNTEMACGIHEIGPSVTVVDKAPVSDVLYILEGDIEIKSNNIRMTYKAGDFAYLPAGEKQEYTVNKHVKLIYVCYPKNWKD